MTRWSRVEVTYTLSVTKFRTTEISRIRITRLKTCTHCHGTDINDVSHLRRTYGFWGRVSYVQVLLVHKDFKMVEIGFIYGTFDGS